MSNIKLKKVILLSSNFQRIIWLEPSILRFKEISLKKMLNFFSTHAGMLAGLQFRQKKLVKRLTLLVCCSLCIRTITDSHLYTQNAVI